MADLYARPDDQGAVAEDLFGTDKHGFTDGGLPDTFEAGTILDARTVNGLIGETMALIELFGLTPDEDNYSQAATGVNRIGLGEFGDGVDGAFAIDAGTITIANDIHLTDLTITSTGVLQTNGYKVFVSGTLTIELGGIIRHNGTVGQDGVAGGAGGAGAASGSLKGGFAGGAGSTNAVGLAGTNTAFALGGAGGVGGANNAVAPIGGAAGTKNIPGNAAGTYRTLEVARRGELRGASSGGFIEGGAGGGGGGGGALTSGGGGGGGGGVVIVWANILVNNGTIQARGGAGGLGQLQSGGGAGGGGGLVYLVYGRKSGSGTVDVAGGAGGLSTTGGAGASGTAGATGTVIELFA